MERLPHIDDHARVVAATPDRVWSALLAVLSHSMGQALPGTLVSVWGLEPPARGGDWGSPAVGDAIPGFAVAEVDPPRLLTLRGRHRFSRYELRFTLELEGACGVEVRAISAAEFPGPLGSIYRTLVIGSRGHVLAVRRLLAQIAHRAEKDI